MEIRSHQRNEEKNYDHERDVDHDCYLHGCLRPNIRYKLCGQLPTNTVALVASPPEILKKSFIFR
jgi:hypothetical protein